MLYEPLKRALDITIALLIGVFFLPIALVAALAIVVDSPGPVFADIPERVGRWGVKFRMFKFRSMYVGSHSRLRTDPSMKKLYNEYKRSSYKLFADPRITPVGKFIRKHSIDETPQLLNVLRGEMSVVGPRAYYQDELEEQTRKYPKTRGLVREMLTVRPGITGPWQVSGRSEVNFDKRIVIDANYARKRSIREDLKILAITPWAMISGKGAV
jgi:lipopolysaccharide/colanic/teichoic acid biosynthesis glycosyltransferase